MNEDQVKSRMQEVLDLVKDDISTVRTGRVSTNLVDEIIVSAYGGAQNLKIMELASITSPDPETIEIKPWDKSIIGDIKKALQTANIGVNPSIDGELIRLSFPPLTTEDRQKYVKILSSKLEQGKVMIRQIRGDIMKDIKNALEAKDLSEDQKFQQEKRLQELTDEYNLKIDDIGAIKEKELLQK